MYLKVSDIVGWFDIHILILLWLHLKIVWPNCAPCVYACQYIWTNYFSKTATVYRNLIYFTCFCLLIRICKHWSTKLTSLLWLRFQPCILAHCMSFISSAVSLLLRHSWLQPFLCMWVKSFQYISLLYAVEDSSRACCEKTQNFGQVYALLTTFFSLAFSPFYIQ